MWQPQQDGLLQILQVLRNANSPDNAVHRQVQQKLHEFSLVPDFNNYLMYILTKCTSDPDGVRALAGILLKNNFRSSANQQSLWDPSTISYLQEACLSSLGDPQPLVRNTVTSLMTTIVTKTGVQQWSNLLPTILQSLDSADYNLVEGAFGGLEKILEDSGQEFRDQALSQPADYIAGKLIAMSESQHTKFRVNSLTCYNFLIQYNVPAAFQRINDFIGALSKRATDPVDEVRALVCRAFVHILDSAPEVVLPGLASISDFMVFSAQDENTDVALDACEFWLAFAEHDELKDHLESIVPRLLPILMKRMVYTDYDIAMLGDDGEDEMVPDREEDIKPRHYKAKTHASDTEKSSGAGAQQPQPSGESDDETDDEDEGDDEIYAEWNLRKCAAATVDVLANTFGAAILPVLLPILNEQLFHADWKVREAGVLCLGAIAEGCMQGVEPHLPQLMPFLFQHLQEPKPLVRSITCWTLGRYCGWAIAQPPKLFLEPLIKGLLEMVLNSNKRVQEAACSALATLEEDGGDILVPYLEDILRVLTAAFSKYQRKNLLILYDAIGTLAEGISEAMNDGKYVDLLMPPLIQKWQSLPDEDTGLFPLLECMSSVAIAFGPSFFPFSQPVFERCCRLIKNTIQEDERAAADPNLDSPDKDFMVVAIDLMSGITQGIGSPMGAIIDSEPLFFKMIFYGMKDKVDEVRQSSFALIGDLAISCFDKLLPHLPTFLPILVEQCQPHDQVSISSCNNACWALGEISLRYGKAMEPFVGPVLQRLIPVLNHPDLPRTMRENAAITIGRVGVSLPELVAPHIQMFIENWCKALRMTRDNAEKESAFLGVCNTLQHNPHGVGNSLIMICESAVSWQRPSPPLMEAFSRVLSGYKSLMGADWDKFTASFPPQSRQIIADIYKV